MSGQPVDAIAASLFNEAVQRALSHQLSIVELINSASKLDTLGQKQLVTELYKTWIAHNSGDPVLHAAYFNYGVALADLGDRAGAINALLECLRLKPDFHPGYINLGRVFEDCGQLGAAVTQWLTMTQRLPAITGETIGHKLTALEQLGRVLESVNRDGAAEDALRQSLDINPRQVHVTQHFISLRQRQCKWPVVAGWDRVSREDLLEGISSLSLMNLADDPMFQLAKAHHYAKHAIGRPKPTPRMTARSGLDRPRLHIGYVSSDLREHAVGFAMTDVVEQHDRDRFEISAYYCGISRTDATQQRTMQAVDRWGDLTGIDDEAAAAKIAADGVDILIDLNGYTKDARTKVFARRPAPIAVNWFGFPGTMGTPYHHYLIADPHVLPPENEIYFSEKVLRLPCYQPNDRRRLVAERRPTRAEAGLPDDAFVYCCLNGMQKITARVYQRWMTILREVPNGVLWLLAGTDETNDRLHQAAAEQGVAPERIVFAEKKGNPDHLARYPLADLFLDSFPYGAHTTASDAMWMNVPILTVAGRTFAARVCAALVRAAGLAEMECATPEAYVARAIEFGLNRDKLAPIKAKLAAGRDASLLFDTPNLVRNLEQLYRRMWDEYCAGALPVPDLRNLDIYHRIGVELDIENIETLGNEAYVALYREKLAAWNEAYPIAPDARLWPGAPQEAAPVIEQRAVA